MNRAVGTVPLALAAAALLASAVACSPKAPAAAVTGPTTAPTAVAAGISATAKTPRVVHLIRDPNVGATVTVAKYWDYGRDAPFQITGFSSKGTAPAASKGSNYVLHTSTTASVSLFDMAKHNFRLLQADAEASGTASTADGAGSGSASADNESADVPDADDAAPVGGAVDTAATSPADEATAFDPDAEDPSEAGDDPSFPPIAEAAQDLSAPHQVDFEGDTPSVMTNVDNDVTFTDQTTGDELEVTYDQAWLNFSFTSGLGTATLELNPDGTYQVDGKGAATTKNAIALLEADPVLAGASRYSLAMVVARLARLAPPASRCGPVYNGGTLQTGGVSTWDILSTGDTAISPENARAYILADAFVKDALRTAVQPAAGK